MPLNYRYDIPEPLDADSIPLDNPLSSARPLRFLDGEVLTAQYRTDPDAIRALVPEPLKVLNDTVMVQIARWSDVPGSGRDTHEANIMVSVEYSSGSTTVRGSYSPYFYVDRDRFMASGREFHGQPKLIADVSLRFEGDLIVGQIKRNGLEVFTATLPYKSRPSTAEALRHRVDPVTNINLKIIRQIDGSPGIRQLTARDLADLTVHDVWTGPSTSEVRPNAQAPLYRLPVLEHLEGYFWTPEFSLTGGVILHDYLAETHEKDNS